MGNQVALLADSSKEVRKRAEATRHAADGGIILVPVDFSEHSEAALVKASEYAQAMSASLVVLHVVHDPGEMPGYYAKLIKKTRVTRIQDMAAEAFDQFMNRASENDPQNEPLREADRLDPMMVVMGSQGRTGLKHLVIGSKAAQIVQLCPVPVTIVKKRDPNE